MLSHPNIFVFDVPRTFYFQFGDVRFAIAGFPFVRDNIRKNIGTVLRKTHWQDEPSDVNILAIHHAVEGATVGPQNYTFRYGADTIRRRDIPEKFACVLTGHIHRQQVLRRDGQYPPVIYPGSIERTSFAEKDEDKGFFLIEFRPDDRGQWALNRLRFQHLPARPMITVLLDASSLTIDNVGHILQTELSKIDLNSVVQLKINGHPSPQILSQMTAQFIRDAAPDTMNISFNPTSFAGRKMN